MFSRLASLLRRFSRSDSSGREIFFYEDGSGQTRAIDPLLAWRRLWSDPECDLAAEAKVARDPQIERAGKPPIAIYAAAEVLAAEEKVINLTRRVFGVKPFEEGGLTLRETDALLGRFLRYADEIKKKRNPSPTPTPALAPLDSPSSDLTPQEPDDTPPAPNTKPDSDCGCTATASSVAAPIS